MAQEIYHRSNWGNPTETWGNSYLNADLTNELYKRASEYENSWVTDQLLNGVGTKPSILLTPTAYDNGSLHSVKPVKTLGDELITNGTFDTDSDWTKGTGWSISGGTANYNDSANASLYQNITLNANSYELKFSISNSSGSGARIWIGTSTGSVSYTDNTYQYYTNGNYTLTINVPSNQTTFAFWGNVGGSSFSIDSVSIKQVTEADFDFTRGSSATRVNEQGLVEDVQLLSGELVQNGDFEQIGSEQIINGGFDTDSDWIKGTGWTIANGKASFDGGSDSAIQQDGVSVSGKKYSVSIEVLDRTTGSLQLRFGSSASVDATITENGVYNYTLIADGTRVYLRSVSGFDGSIDNVSIKEVIDADFDFTRGSSATRVNEKGLVQDVQLLSGELVQNGDFEQIGSELVTNGSFDTDSDWTKQTGWSISGGVANYDFTSDAKYIRQTLLNGGFVSGKTYRINFEITSGTAYLYINSNGGSLISLNTYSVGSYSLYTTATANGSDLLIYGRNTSGTAFSIDNVSVKEVGQNWTFDNSGGSFGWQIYDGKAICDGNASTAYRNLVSSTSLTSGKKYRLNLDILQSADNITVYVGGGAVSETLPTGTNLNYTLEFTATSSGALTFYAGTDDLQELDNISVVEVTDDTDLPRINYTNFDYEDVLGDELVNYDNFNYGSGGWSLVGSKWVFDDITNGYLVIDNIDVEVGQKYQVTVNISIDSGNANFRITSGNGQTQLFNYTDFADGETTFETTVSGVDGTLQRLFAVTSLTDNPFTLNSISVKELTEDVVVPYSGEGSLLLEPQSTNLVTYSEDYSQTDWSKTNISITTNSTISPDGTINASLLTENNSNAQHFIGDALSLTSGTSYSVSVYAKKKERSVLQISPSSSHIASSYANYDLDLGVVSATGGSVNAEIEYLSNDWYRCILKFTATNTATATFAFFMQTSTTALRGASYQGDGTSGLYLWGAQAEALSYATSYIPTNGSTVTRLADVCNNSGNSDLINSTEGVLYAEISALANYNTQRWLSLSDSTHSNAVKIGLLNSATDFRFAIEVRSGGSTQAFMAYNFGAITPTMTKIAIKFKQNDFALWVNGVERATDTSGNTPTGLSELSFDRGDGGQDFEGNVKCVAVFKEALSDTELEKLTTI